MPSPDRSVETTDTLFTLPCDHSFAYSTLSESVDTTEIEIDEIGSTADGVMYMEVSFTCPRCQTPVEAELLESVIMSPE